MENETQINTSEEIPVDNIDKPAKTPDQPEIIDAKPEELEHKDLNEDQPKIQAKVYEPLPMEPISEANIREDRNFTRVGPDGQPLRKKI